MTYTASPSPFFGKTELRAWRDDRQLFFKADLDYQVPQKYLESTKSRARAIAAKIEQHLEPGLTTKMTILGIWPGGKLAYELEVYQGPDPKITIMADEASGTYQLEERYYPNNGATYSTGEYPGTDQTQINIFGTWKTLAGALNSYTQKGNSTDNNRKPTLIYV